jgi:trimeric autotransporter adhesin
MPHPWYLVALAFMAACGSSITADEPTASEVAEIVVAPLTASVTVGGELPMQAAVRDASGQLVTGAVVVWTVQDSTVATVSTTGIVTARAVGSTQVAASANGVSGIASVRVIPEPVASVTVAPARIDLAPGTRSTLGAIPYDAAGNALVGRALVWASSNTSIATVDAAGTVAAVAPGSATITATSEGVSGSAAVSVAIPAVASVAIQPRGATIQRGTTLQLSATVNDESGAAVTDRALTWTSSNPGVAVVSASGVVSGVALGTASIRAALDGKADTVSIAVVAVPVGSVTVQPSTASLPIGQSTTLTATVKDANGNVVTDHEVAWTSSNALVATVATNGVVKALSAGTAIISATSDGSSGSATVTVTAPTPPSNVVYQVLITPASIDNLRHDHSVQLSAKAVDEKGNTIPGAVFTWHSNNTYVATVNSSGLVTGEHSGTTTITATFSGKTGSASVRVK